MSGVYEVFRKYRKNDLKPLNKRSRPVTLFLRADKRASRRKLKNKHSPSENEPIGPVLDWFGMASEIFSLIRENGKEESRLVSRKPYEILEIEKYQKRLDNLRGQEALLEKCGLSLSFGERTRKMILTAQLHVLHKKIEKIDSFPEIASAQWRELLDKRFPIFQRSQIN